MKTRRLMLIFVIAALLLTTQASMVVASPLRSSCTTYYTVQFGENLYRVGLRFGVTVQQLMLANGIINPDLVYAGQRLCIPGATTPPPPPPPPTCGKWYTVQWGDTLSVIAQRYGVSMYQIMRANNLANANFVYAGMILWIPCTGGTSGGTSYAQWKGEYFNNPNLAGAPSVVRNDAAVSFNWGAGWPNPRIAADNFSVRWTRTLYFNQGTFRISASADDGIRVFVDNLPVIDEWHTASGATYTADITLGTGNHTWRVEYYEATGNAFAYVSWARITSPGPYPTPIPGATPTPPATAGGAWTGYYYANMFLDDLAFARIDPAINFDWGKGSPGPGVPRDLFSVRWISTQYFANGLYQFNAIVDDGVRIYVDDNLVLNEWFDHPGLKILSTAQITAGPHTVKVEYYDRGREATIVVWWDKVQ
jgi:LysM repeat protein